MRTPLLIATLCLSFSIAPAQAGQLDNLEREATKSPSKSPSKSKSKKSGSNSKTSFSDELKNEVASETAKALIKAAPDIITFGAKVIGYSALTVVAGAVGSNERSLKSQPNPIANNEQDPENPKENPKENKNKEFGADFFRVNGDPLLPTLRASTHGLYSGNNIHAQLNRIEAGYSFLGISYSQNSLNEDGDQLKLANTLIHYRMSFHNDFSWDFAYGRGKMNGNQKHDGSVFAMPVRLRFHPDWHFEYYPVWSSYKGGSLSEHQFSFNYHYKYIGATVGYKTWSAGTASVDGLFTGLYLSF